MRSGGVNTTFPDFGQPHTLPRSSFDPFPSFAFPSAGAVDKLTLPEGMQTVNFYYCQGLTGTAEFRTSDGQEGSLNIIIFI